MKIIQANSDIQKKFIMMPNEKNHRYRLLLNQDYGKWEHIIAPAFYSDYMLYADIVNQYHLQKNHKGAIIRPEYLSVRYIVSGSQYVKCNGKIYLAEQHDLMLMPPDCDYFYATGPDGYCFQRSITMKGTFIQQILSHLGMTNDFCLTLDNPYFYCRIHDRLKNILKKDDATECEENQAICFLLLQKIANLHNTEKLPELLLNSQHYIEKNLEKGLSLEEIASKFQRCPSTLNKLYRKYLNTSVHQYIISRRMGNALQMLRDGRYSIKEIAAANGFCSLSNFSTEFKKYYGKNPRAYKFNNIP